MESGLLSLLKINLFILFYPCFFYLVRKEICFWGGGGVGGVEAAQNYNLKDSKKIRTADLMLTN